MRIERLDLVRYGRFTDASLELPRGRPDLHIAVGPNEAGKSTVLEALEDLLFGIKARSDMNFLHSYRDMLLGAAVEANGKQLAFRRRKGNKNTLLTAEGAPMSAGERALAPFTGNVDRAFFGRMFNLDHERLRDGGREILQDRDEIGQMLFSAGSGIQDLRKRLAALDQKADSLWAPRRSAKRKFYQAHDRLKASESEKRDGIVTAAKWRELKKAYERRRSEFQELQVDVEAKRAKLRGIQRIRRVAQDVGWKLEIDDKLAQLRSVADLPADARDGLQAAEADVVLADRRLEDAKSDLDSLQQDRGNVSWDDALVRRADEVQKLHTLRIQVEAERSDLPKRERELYAAEDRIRELGAELGWESEDLESILSRIPSTVKVKRTRKLLRQRGTLARSMEKVQVELDAAERRLADCANRIRETGAASDVTRLSAVLSAASGEHGEIGSSIRSAQNRAREAGIAADRLASSLDPPLDQPATDSPPQVPPTSTVGEFRDDRRRLDQLLRDCRRSIRNGESKLRRKRQARDRFVAEKQPVTREEVQGIRDERDRLWRDIRARVLEGKAAFDVHTDAPEAVAKRYEGRVEAADSAADRRLETVEAAAQLAEIDRSIDSDRAALSELKVERERLEEEASRNEERWTRLWSDFRFSPRDPNAMLDWLAKHEQLQRQLAAGAEADREIETLQRQEQRAISELKAELETLQASGIPGESLGLRVMLEFAKDIKMRNQQAKEARERLEADLANAESRLERKRSALRGAQRKQFGWGGRWAQAVADLGLDPADDPDQIDDQIQSIEKLRSLVNPLKDLRDNRVGKIKRDIEDFRRESDRTLQAVAEDLLPADSFESVPVLEARLVMARKAREQALQLDKQIKRSSGGIRKLREQRRLGEEAIARLHSAARTDTVEQLWVEIEKAEQHRKCVADKQQVETRLQRQGDGLSIPQLVAECEDVDLDAAAAEQTTLEEDTKALQDQLLEARDKYRAAQTAFKAVGGGDAAAVAESKRQGAIAEIREVAEEYARVRGAALLLRWAIDRHRREKQGPLLKKAAQLFGQLTLGSFQRLELDYDRHDRPILVGRRPSGERVGVEGMSDGSLDQLYLALRIAALEHYFEQAEPLPFVADDLFINFDNARAAAGFQVLGQLAERCQVLFFTHHEHLVDLARSALAQPPAVVRMKR